MTRRELVDFVAAQLAPHIQYGPFGGVQTPRATLERWTLDLLSELQRRPAVREATDRFLERTGATPRFVNDVIRKATGR